jgi:hypothetical protein
MGWTVGVRFSADARGFSFLHIMQTGSGGHPSSHTMGTGGYFERVKWPGREAERLPPSSAEANGGAIPLLPQMSSWRGT